MFPEADGESVSGWEAAGGEPEVPSEDEWCSTIVRR
jgi:hypothetical protein